jgi:cellulose synthase/poly-beta-1,6-N-acetylglucosamine synthase-like glycosyltransferase
MNLYYSSLMLFFFKLRFVVCFSVFIEGLILVFLIFPIMYMNLLLFPTLNSKKQTNKRLNLNYCLYLLFIINFRYDFWCTGLASSTIIYYLESSSCINYTSYDKVRSKDIYLFFNININNCF